MNPRNLCRGLLDNSYDELPITGEYAVALDGLPPIHKDPSDRTLIVQSMVEGNTLLTADPLIAQYPLLIRKVRGRDARRARLSQAQSPVQDRV